MIAIRRIYFYLVSGVSLAVLLIGLTTLGSVILELLLGGTAEASARNTIASSLAAVVVAAPVWALHWRWAQQTARRDPTERASALRHLYLYGGGAVLALTAIALVNPALSELLGTIEVAAFRPLELLRSLWQASLLAAFWAYHFQRASADRADIGEDGASATLRRWYAYGIQVVAFLNLLFWAQVLLAQAAATVLGPRGVVGGGPVVSTEISYALVWLALWLFHFRWTARGVIAADDRASTLRAVHGFGIVAWCTVVTLTEAARTLYYFLARALGVAAAGGIQQLDAATLAQPLSAVLVFGLGWAFARQLLVTDAAAGEAPRQAGVRRLYVHLVALVSLVAFAIGLGALLDALFEQVVAPTAASDAWRDRISWALTLIVVGLPVWLVHWRAAPDAAERLALSRRLYLFAALLLGVLGVLGSAGALVSTLLRAALATGAVGLGVDASSFLAALIVAAGVAGYHFRVLRQDAAQRPMAEPIPPEPEAPLAQTAADFLVEVSGATEAELRQALAGLPSEVRYSLRPSSTEGTQGSGP